MIRSFSCKETRKVWKNVRSASLPVNIQGVAFRRLLALNSARTLLELRIPPSNRLKKLRGDREGQWSIRINDQWRICFEWKDGHAYNVKIEDYH